MYTNKRPGGAAVSGKKKQAKQAASASARPPLARATRSMHKMRRPGFSQSPAVRGSSHGPRGARIYLYGFDCRLLEASSRSFRDRHSGSSTSSKAWPLPPPALPTCKGVFAHEVPHVDRAVWASKVAWLNMVSKRAEQRPRTVLRQLLVTLTENPGAVLTVITAVITDL